MPTDETKAQIKASQGILSLSAAAKKFGVSRRTVGRIYHGGELSKARNTPSADMDDSLRQQVAKLSEMVVNLSKQVEALSRRQAFRQSLNPALHQEEYLSSPHEFSSPYRDSPYSKRLVNIYGIRVPVPSGWEQQARDAWFISQHPASPGCSVYPYPQTPQSKNPEGSEAPLVYSDPPVGKSCTCKECQSWRLGLAYEAAILRAYTRAVGEHVVFHSVGKL